MKFILLNCFYLGFDDIGRQYDSDGNLFNWWQPETEQRFLEKVQCIIWQYGNYTDPRTNLPVTLNTYSLELRKAF